MRATNAIFSGVILTALCAAGCGGGGTSGPPPPPPDFQMNVTPTSLSMIVGTISPQLLVTAKGNVSFMGHISVAITGLPTGATTSPAAPFTLTATQTVGVTIFIPPGTPTGSLSLQVTATSGDLSHTSMINLDLTPVSGTASLQEVAGGQLAADTIEIQGVSSGSFTPSYRRKNTLNWVPDVRMPMLAPQTTGSYQNIYAPWPLEQGNGWRFFYGGWDGTDTPYDQIYSVTTNDFLTFTNRDHIISNGQFVNVNNVNVQQLPDGSLHMICTGGNDIAKPVYFESPDGKTWNGSPEPYAAQLSDIITIQGYATFSSGDFNGSNVLLRDKGEWVLDFKDWKDFHTTYWATADTLPDFQLQGVALLTDHLVQDVKKFTVNGIDWYVMGLYLGTSLHFLPGPASFVLS